MHRDILLLQLYNSLWVSACSIISFHFFLSCVVCFQLFTPIFLKSYLTSSSHLTLGLPFSLVAYGFHLYMVLATLSLVILSTCPNQPSHLYCIYLTIFLLLIVSSNSSFVLSLHSLFAFCVGPNILLNIFLSNTNNFCLMFSVKTQHSDPYTTTGLTRALYNFILVFSDISLLWSITWHHIPEVCSLDPHCRKNLQSYTSIYCWCFPFQWISFADDRGSATDVIIRCLEPGFVLRIIRVSFISLSSGQITWTRHNLWSLLNDAIDNQGMACSSVFRLQASIWALTWSVLWELFVWKLNIHIQWLIWK